MSDRLVTIVTAPCCVPGCTKAGQCTLRSPEEWAEARGTAAEDAFEAPDLVVDLDGGWRMFIRCRTFGS